MHEIRFVLQTFQEMAKYSKRDYWDARYKQDPDPFEWYQTYDGVRRVVRPILSPASKILHIGCGNSRLQEDLFYLNIKDIVNIDVSPVVIQAMKAKYASKPELKFATMDVMALDFPDNTFDVILDKGTLDCVLCGDEAAANATKMLSEVYRVLRRGGAYLVISYAGPDNRFPYLKTDKLNWRIEGPTAIPKPALLRSDIAMDDSDGKHYVYILYKPGGGAVLGGGDDSKDGGVGSQSVGSSATSGGPSLLAPARVSVSAGSSSSSSSTTGVIDSTKSG